jgi:hypothetical protein
MPVWRAKLGTALAFIEVIKIKRPATPKQKRIVQ